MADIRLEDIARSLPPAAEGGLRDFGATVPGDRIVLTGGREGLSTPSGPRVNLQDTEVTETFETRVTRPANVVLHMVLDGTVDTRLGAEALPLSRSGTAPVRLVFSATARPAPFRRRIHKGQRLRKVTVVMSWDWLAARGLDRDTVMAGTDHRCESWIAAAANVAQAEALLRGTGPASLRLLEKEALAISLLRHAMEGLLSDPAGLRRQDRDRLHRMESHALRPGPLPTLEEIAAAGGMSLSSMQRLFRRAHGRPVLSHLRALRMERAASALRDGHAVTDAARIAGYESAAAFATAFRQQMGMSPSQYATGRD
ncbi:helix-turn-helix transcriptional regulator [Pseudooceanicola nanhaiensis]|uniref:helix-turn-helix transcriptional regulator n=1 Tax=Pseudooceanicola nanhaiensis TaxID=375761 RepID=UPI001CD2B153|nr:helix-turn-helix transcriptional regulator [Pseudooceanicola nanhaiensis]MCA0919308.1 helix-turn-helix transcriptional regulator [Pseudooceanicola nanhaiensis]